MKRLLLTAALSLLASPAFGQTAFMQLDANGFSVQDFFRLGSGKSVSMGPAVGQDVTALADNTRLVLVTCTAACNVAQGMSPQRAHARDFQLPANVLLRLRVNKGDGLAFFGASGTAWVVELQ